MPATNTNNIASPAKQPGEAFVVKQWGTANALIAIVFYIMASATLYNIVAHSKHSFIPGLYLPLLMFAVAIASTAQAFNKKAYLEINKAGIYTNGSLLAAWPDFIAADFYEKAARRDSAATTFIVRILHRKPGIGDFEADITMESTLNKSPEEVVGAIKYFYGEWAARGEQ